MHLQPPEMPTQNNQSLLQNQLHIMALTSILYDTYEATAKNKMENNTALLKNRSRIEAC